MSENREPLEGIERERERERYGDKQQEKEYMDGYLTKINMGGL